MPPRASAHAFADRLGRFFERYGMPRMGGRVLGHLLTCDPPAQTFDELVAAVGASRSTVSVVTRLLQSLGLIERFGVAGERKDRYRLRADAWTRSIEEDVVAARALKELAAEGLAVVASRPPAARARLRGMREFYAFLEAEQTSTLARWRRRSR